MKSFKFFPVLLAFVLMFFLVRCSDDDPEPTPNLQISGKVTFVDGPAAGAVVYMAKSSTPTMEYSKIAVADASGNYSFAGLEPGMYYLYANFDTKNSNIPDARFGGMIFNSGDDNLVNVEGGAVTHDITLENSGTTGAEVDLYDENGPWSFDKTHSIVYFEFDFDEENAVFAGHFTQFDIDVLVDENDLANAKIDAWVDVTTINTTQPGRDGTWTDYGDSTETFSSGCIGNYLGATTGRNEETVMVPGNRYATFSSTEITRYGDGFKAVGDFYLNGETSTETLYFKYNPGFIDTDNNRLLASFEGELVFNPLGSYNIESGHLLNADVTLNIGCQLRKSLD